MTLELYGVLNGFPPNPLQVKLSLMDRRGGQSCTYGGSDI